MCHVLSKFVECDYEQLLVEVHQISLLVITYEFYLGVCELLVHPISDLVAFKANVNELVGLAPMKQGLDKKFHDELNCKACRFELDS